MSRERVLGLFKFGERRFMEELVSEGHVFMNTLAYYAELEAGSAQADKDEGSAHCIYATGGELQIEKDGNWVPVGTINGPLVSRDPATLQMNAYCMFAFRESHAASLIDTRNLSFGDTFVAFTDGDEFLRRVRAAAAREGVELSDSLVQYVDRETYSGPMGPFRKFAEHAHQSELRLLVRPGGAKPLSLRIGSLADITRIGPLSDLHRRIRVEQPEPAREEQNP